MIAWMLLGCGEGEVRSVPTAPTVAFDQGAAAQQVAWTDLQDFLPTAPAGLPAGLDALRPKMTGEEARRILDAAHEPGARIFQEAGQTTVAMSSILHGHPNVSASIILNADATELVEVDLSLPQDVAEPLLTARWGAPASTEMLDGARPVHHWRPAGSTWWADLQPKPFADVAPGIPAVAPKKALLRYLPAQPSSPPIPPPASH